MKLVTNKSIGSLFLLLPLFVSTLNLQNLALLYYSSIVQVIAYLSLVLVFIGAFFFLKKEIQFPKIVLMWFWFFAIYYCFGLLANVVEGNKVLILKQAIPIIYLISFSIYLGIVENHIMAGKFIAISFFISCLLLIYFHFINFDLDHRGIYKYDLDRAGGVYGDANQAALVALLAFVLLKKLFVANTIFQKIIKNFVLLITLYAFLLTFSKTGFIILLFVLGFTYHKLLNPKFVLFTIIFAIFILTSAFSLALKSDILSEAQQNRILDLGNILTLQTDKIDYSGRNHLLENMMNFIYENPILGNGIEFSVGISGHNTIMGIWADAGILTFLFFVILLLRQFKLSIDTTTKNRYFLLSCYFILTVYMMSLQSIITEPYLLVVFIWLGYFIDLDKKSQRLTQ